MTLLAGVLVYGLLGYSITSNMLTPLLPELESAYHISAVGAIWISLVALLSGAAFIPTACRLGDTLGWKKSVAIGALGCLVVGGVIAAASTSVPLLLVGRAFQGVGLAVFPMLVAITNDEFPVVRRKVAISLLSGALFFGSGFGGVLAGLIVEHHSSFRIVFWLSVLLPLIGIVLLSVFVPRGRGPAADAPDRWWQAIDLPGAAGFAIPAIALDIAFSEESAWGWGSPKVITLIIVAVVAGFAWVLVERRVRSPLVDQKIFWSRPIWVNNAVAVLFGFGLFGAVVATSTFAQMPPVPGLNGLGASPVAAAWVIVPAEWAMVIVGPLSGYMSRRMGKGPFLTGGALVEALGLLLLLAFHSSLAELAVCMAVVGIGVGAVASSFGLIYAEDVPPEHVGRLSGIAPILASGVGGSVAGALLGAFLTSSHLPSGLPTLRDFEAFWILAAGLTLLGAAFAAVYLVTFWNGMRGDRAMVRRPLDAAAAPASESSPTSI
jgi:MFS family permease